MTDILVASWKNTAGNVASPSDPAYKETCLSDFTGLSDELKIRLPMIN